MVQLRNNCNCVTCYGSSANDPAYASMNKRLKEGEMVFGGYRCLCRCHSEKKSKAEKKGGGQ